MSRTGDGLTGRFVEALWTLSWATAPASAQTATLRLLRDHVAVVIGGSATESAAAMLRYLQRWPSGIGTPQPVFGTQVIACSLDAAMANAVAAHSMEFDDVHCPASLHPGTVVFPAAFAAYGIQPVAEACFLTAVLRGYEAMCRVGRALNPVAHYARHFHPTATAGTFGAAVVAASILGFDEAATVAALGIAASMPAGSMEFLTDGVWTKRLHPAFAVRNGLQAALLAAEGIPAPQDGIAGERGFLQAYSAEPNPQELLDGFGVRELEVGATSIKPHACCRYVQAPIDALLSLRKAHGIAAHSVRSVRLGIPSVAANIVAEPVDEKSHPASVLDAQFSAPFGAAVALISGRAGPGEYTASTIETPAVRALMERVSCTVDPELDRVFPAEWRAWAEITIDEGSMLRCEVAAPKGDPANPIDAEELAAKIHQLVAPRMGAGAEAALLRALDGFGTEGGLARLLAAASAGGGRC